MVLYHNDLLEMDLNIKPLDRRLISLAETAQKVPDMEASYGHARIHTDLTDL